MQLVERYTFQRNHPHDQEIETLYLVAKKLYNQTNRHIYASSIFHNHDHNIDFLSQQLRYFATYQDLSAQNRKIVLLNLYLYLEQWQSLLATQRYKKYQYKFRSKNKINKYKYIFSQYKYPIKNKDLLSSPDDRGKQLKLKMPAGLIDLLTTLMREIPVNDNNENSHPPDNYPEYSHFVVGIMCKHQGLDYDIEENAIATTESGIAKLATLVNNKIAIVVIAKELIINSVHHNYSWHNQVKYNFTSLLPTSQTINTILRSFTPRRISPVESYLYQANQLMIDPITKHGIKNFHSKNNSLDQDYGKLSEDSDYKLGFNHLARFIKQWICQLTIWVRRFLCEDFNHCQNFCCDSKQDIISSNAQTDAYRTKYSGQKIRTKLYKSGDGLLIHADINDSLNVLRKVIPKAFSQGIQGAIVRPVGVYPANKQQENKYSCSLKL
jgi:putative transposase